MESNESSDARRVTPENMSYFTYAKRSHWPIIGAYAKEMYGEEAIPSEANLKQYQDLLVYAFIRENLAPGARLLDVGGGNARVLRALSNEYECWNIDPYKGVGNGPVEPPDFPCKLVLDYMGNFNSELPEDYFDLIFSISALEHTPDDQKRHRRILKDMQRVSRPEGYSLHLLDIVFRTPDNWIKDFLYFMFQEKNPFNDPLPSLKQMEEDPDLYVMTKAGYDKYWKSKCHIEYEEFGRPTSVNVLWQEPAYD